MLQWNPSITDTFGEQYNVLAFIQRWPLLRGCFVHKLFIWDRVPGRYIATGFNLFGGGLENLLEL